MPYYLIENFSRGIDRSRLSDTGVAGALWEATNVWINRGGQVEKRLAFDEVEYITTALRHSPSRTIALRGLVPSQIQLLSHVDRDTLNAAGKWPHGDATGDTPYSAYTGLDFYWLNADYGANTSGVLWFAISFAYQNQNAETVGYSGLGSFGGRNYLDISDIEQTVFAGGIDAPGGSGGTWTGDATANPRNNPRFKLSAESKIYDVTGFEVRSGQEPSGTTGSGSAELLNQAGYMGVPLALAPYYSQVVIFGEYGCQFWNMDVDWAESSYSRNIENMPLVAPRSVTPYAGGDVMFLAADGVRSLQARDSSNLASVGDIGTPIDDLILEADRKDVFLAIGAVHTQTGQFWLFLEEYVYVLSRYPKQKVLGWTRYSLPETDGGGTTDFTGHPDNSGLLLSENAVGAYAADVMPANLDLAFRTFEDRFFVYGGENSATYDSSEAVVQIPWLDFGRPGDAKVFSGVDIACVGTWTIEASFDPFNIIWEEIATISNTTFQKARIPMQGTSEHVSIRLRSTDASRAVIGTIGIHYELAGKQ